MAAAQQPQNKKDVELWSLCKKSAHEAVSFNRVANLLRGGADVNIRSNGWTVLLWVCWKNQNDSLAKLIRLFLIYGANANDTDANGNRALHILCRFNQTPSLIRSIKALTDSKVDLNVTDRKRWGVLHYLARFNQSKELLPIMELLLENGANVQATDLEGWNVLHYLARFYQGTDLIQFFHLMIRHKINLEARDLEGWNVLHILCRYYSQRGKLLPIFQLLVENGVDIHCQTYKKLHALELMLFNPCGDFHSACTWMMSHRHSDWKSLVWNDESVLNMAKLGCQEWTYYFSEISSYQCHSDKGKSATDYLNEVCYNSTTLCPQCQPTWQFDKFFVYNQNESETISKPIRRVKFTKFVPSIHEKLMPLRSCSIVSSEHDLKPVPEPDNWRWMASAWQKDKLSLDEVEFYLSEHSHWQCLHSCRWCIIFRHVRKYLNSLIDTIRELDDRFESGPLIEYGSWAERSDILAANEFDFGIPLKHFSALAQESGSSTDVGVVFAKENAEVDAFYTDYFISSGRLLFYYKSLIEEASSRIWNVRFFHPVVSLSETCVTLTFVYRGRREKPMKISIDLSLVVTLTGINGGPFQDTGAPHLPDVLCKLNAQQNEVRERHLVPYRRNERGRWKVSHFALERDVFLHQSCFPDVSRVLRLLKFFVLMANHRKNPHRDGVEHTIQRKTSPSSYALKTCLFHYMKNCRPPWDPADRINHCIGVLQTYLAQGPQIKSFFAKNVAACDISHDSRLIVMEILTKLDIMKKQQGYSLSFDQDVSL
ncbi:uncharacterized protein LOC130696631 [Daphnia carinata]|uniref:uncharacterized protein LOC130696631 n=1 Tax=Daphnia carinata TaxID=120202 RepID=UPI0025796159|nr:uncharacterized protein LOC130696631 [Daphnia carinata]